MRLVVDIVLVLFAVLPYFQTSVQAEVACSNATVAKTLHREKRIVFTYNSATGILAALSIPLVIPNRNIYVAYNFEMNYNMPTDSTDYTQGVLKRVESPDIQAKRDVGRELSKVKRVPTYTRKKIYRSIETNLNRHGLNGKRCILRAICEASSSPLFEHNGILGDLIHILLTPSHSKDEYLPPEFYRAEQMGHEQDCSRYHRFCPSSLLDVISVLI